jgi:hypothetical protein
MTLTADSTTDAPHEEITMNTIATIFSLFAAAAALTAAITALANA